jgi:hypothetical protein
MITYVERTVLKDLPANSIVLNQVNTQGYVESGLQAKIAHKYPKVFESYHNECGWFKGDHEHELIGRFYSVKAADGIVVCNAFAQSSNSKTGKQETDYNAWKRICKEIEKQVSSKNKQSGENWQIHASDKLGCSCSNGSEVVMQGILEDVFENSDVSLVLHRT